MGATTATTTITKTILSDVKQTQKDKYAMYFHIFEYQLLNSLVGKLQSLQPWKSRGEQVNSGENWISLGRGNRLDNLWIDKWEVETGGSNRRGKEEEQEIKYQSGQLKVRLI